MSELFRIRLPFASAQVSLNIMGEVCALDLLDVSAKPQPARSVAARRVARQLQNYLQSPASGNDVPLSPAGTDFQQRVWRALQQIPAGEVRTYGELARQLHSAPRAIGQACRRNPIPILIPCHRVVAASGIGGFSGETAGPVLARKRWLLAHEGWQG